MGYGRFAVRKICVAVLAALLIMWHPSPVLAGEADPGGRNTQVLGTGNISMLSRLVQIGKGEPHAVYWSPDGETVALATGTGVHLFNGHGLQPVCVLPSGYTTLLSFSADSSLLAAGAGAGRNQSIQLWDVKGQRLVREIKQDRTLSAVHIDQQKGEILALGQKNTGTTNYGVPLYKGYLDTYALKTGGKKASVGFQSSEKQLMKLSLCPGGRTIFMAGLREYAFLDFKGKTLYKGSLPFAMGTMGVANAGMGALVDYTQPSAIRLIDLKAGQEAGKINLDAGIGDMALDDTGETLLFYTPKGWQAHSLATGELTARVTFSEYSAMSARLSPLRDRLAALDGDRLLLVDLAGKTVPGTQEGFLPRAWQAAVSGGVLAAAKRSGKNNEAEIHLWDLDEAAGAAQAVVPLAGTEMPDLAISPDGSRLASLQGNTSGIDFFSLPGGAADGKTRFGGTLRSACVSAGFSTLMAGFGGSVEVWQTGGSAPLMKAYMNGSVNRVSLSADGSRAAAVDSETASVWDVPGQERLLDIRSTGLSTGILSPDGATFAVVLRTNKGYSVKLYNVAKAKALWTCAIGENFEELCFSPDGALLAASGYGDGLAFINPANGRRIYTLDYNTADFSFSPDGRLIATASSDGTVGIWGVP